MHPIKEKAEEKMLEEKIENLIAIGAAVASNCIPCFQHIYEKAITSGIPLEEIKRASDIAEQVKDGAQIALNNTVGELVGNNETRAFACKQIANKTCGC